MPRGFNETAAAFREGCNGNLFSYNNMRLISSNVGNADLLPATDWLRDSKIAFRNSLNPPRLRAAMLFCDVEGKRATKGSGKETGR
jgi:hypothetical protein